MINIAAYQSMPRTKNRNKNTHFLILSLVQHVHFINVRLIKVNYTTRGKNTILNKAMKYENFPDFIEVNENLNEVRCLVKIIILL